MKFSKQQSPDPVNNVPANQPTGRVAVLNTRIPVIPSRRCESGRARIAHYDPGSAASAAFHRLVDELCPIGSQGPQLICVTSAVREQGRSLCAANLAITLANTNRRVLLVDADSVNPQQRVTFHDSDLDGDDSLIRPTDVAGLDLLAQAADDVRSTEATSMSFARLESMRTFFTNGYDMIVVDAPPTCEWGVAGNRFPLEHFAMLLEISDQRNQPTAPIDAHWRESRVRTRVLLNRAGTASFRGSGLAARFWVR